MDLLYLSEFKIFFVLLYDSHFAHRSKISISRNGFSFVEVFVEAIASPVVLSIRFGECRGEAFVLAIARRTPS